MDCNVPSLINLHFDYFCKNLHVLQVSGSLNNVCPSCSIRNLESAVSSSSRFETTDPPTGHVRVSTGDPVTSEGQKLHPYSMLTAIFLHEEPCYWVAPVASAGQDNYLTFSLSSVTLPHAPCASALSHKYSEPLALGEADLRLVLLCPHLAASWINLLSDANLHVSAFGLLDFGAKFSNKWTWYFKYKKYTDLRFLVISKIT